MNETDPAIAEAVRLVSQGQWGLAERTLGQVLGRRPQEPDALQLMGLVRAHQGRVAEAESLYRRSLAFRPKQANVLMNLGRLLATSGRADEGIEHLRSAVRLEPRNPDAVLMLGQIQHGIGAIEFAERNLRAALKLSPNNLTAMLSLGGLLNDAGRAAEGEAVLRAALALAPPPSMRAALEHNLGVALTMQGRHAEAVTAFDAALDKVPDLPRAHANRASALHHLGRKGDAVEAFRRAVVRDPSHLAAHKELNGLLYRLGRDTEFLTSYDEAIARGGDAANLLVAKGGMLTRLERFDEALDCFDRAVASAPDSPTAHAGRGLATAGLGRLDDAVASYEKSLALDPKDVPTRINLAGTLLRSGDAGRALALTDAATAEAPLDQAALAIHELALRLAGDPRAEILADYERHVQVFDLEVPEGFTDMASFNAALNAHLDTLHGDTREHLDQTLRRGTQTLDPLFDGDNPLVAALRKRIEEAVRAYIARMSDGAGHPLTSRRTDGFRFTGSWSSRLRDRGFHTNHVHPKGWISSCYYVALPEAVTDAAAKQGWIKFGEPSFPTGLNDPIRRTVQPVAGRLVLFPSYMWHGTVPFTSGADRTTIAFDAVPL